MQAEYAANLLYIPGLCFSKLSVLAMIRTITPARTDQLLVYGLVVTIIIWALTAELTAAFQCQAQKPYDYVTGTCFDRVGHSIIFRNSYADDILDCLDELSRDHKYYYRYGFNCAPSLHYLERQNLYDTESIHRPRLRTSHFVSFQSDPISLYSLPHSVMAVSICKLVYWNRVSNSPDPTLDLWPVAICTELVQCLEILAACCLYLKPFLESLESGFIRGGDLRRRGEDSLGGSGHRTASIPLSSRRPPSSIADRNLARYRNTAIAERFDPDDDAESLNSQSQIIRETRTWAVETSTDVPRES